MKPDRNGSRIVSRRKFTALTGSALAVGAAGCLGEDSDNEPEADSEFNQIDTIEI